LILTIVAFLPMTFLALGGGDGAAIALSLRLSVCVLIKLALGPLDEALTKSALGARVERQPTLKAWNVGEGGGETIQGLQ
jgi:hypothetical protein